eukprot:Rmarinus@m.15126
MASTPMMTPGGMTPSGMTPGGMTPGGMTPGGMTPGGFGGMTPAAAASPVQMLKKQGTRLPPEVNRILYVRNLPFKISAEEMYDIFGKYGAIRQIRIGTTPETRGTAFVVYEDIYEAKNACEHLSGFNVANRYLIVLYHQATKQLKKVDAAKKKAEIEQMKEKYGMKDED